MTYHRGKLDGRSTWYYEHGKKRMEIDYVSGRKHGAMSRFFRNGALETQQNYNNDTLEGISQEYSNDGTLISEIIYKKGQKEGAFRQYYKDGTLSIEGNFTKDRYDGGWKYYDADGFLVGEANFSAGNGMIKMFDTDGILMRTIPYVDNVIDGIEEYYDKNGKIEKTILYTKGRLVEIKNNNN